MNKEKQIENYFDAVYEQIKKQNFTAALNLLTKISELDPNNKQATTSKQFIEEIIKFNNLDVFASTNLFMDPWE